VTEVHASGRPLTRVPAWIERAGGGRLDLLVSAEKAGGMVVLRVDRAG
jgi:hypothetical protein